MSICEQKQGPPFYIVVHCKNAVEMQFTGMQTNSFVDCHLKAIAQPQAVITSHSVLECQPAIHCEARPLLSVTNNATCYGAKGRLWSGSSIRITASYIRIADEDHVSRLSTAWIWTVPWFVHNIKGSWSFVLFCFQKRIFMLFMLLVDYAIFAFVQLSHLCAREGGRESVHNKHHLALGSPKARAMKSFSTQVQLALESCL